MKKSTKQLIIKELGSALLGVFIYISLLLIIPVNINEVLNLGLFLVSILMGGWLYEIIRKYMKK